MVPAEHGELARRLRGARDRRGITVAELARITRIAPWVLEGLEAARHERLPSPAYVRGYLRCCAQALDVPPGMLLSAYQDGARPRPLTPLLSPAVAPRRVSDRLPVSFAVALLTLLVLFVLAAALSMAPRGRTPVRELVSQADPPAAEAGGSWIVG